MKKDTLLVNLLLIIILFTSCFAEEDNIKENYFTISAISKSNNTLVNGGVYKLLDSDGNLITTYKLDNGTIKVCDLPSGNYTIVEVVTPEGYIPVEEFEQKKFISISNKPDGFVFFYNTAPSKTLDVSFHSTQSGLMENYTAIRIGEYYWIDKNFHHIVPEGNIFENRHPITQKTLDKYIERIKIDKSLYQLQNIHDFEKYYGRYYSYASILYMNKYGYVKNAKDEIEDGWRLPFPEDYRQLFAMSPFNTSSDQQHTTLNERDVRFALGAKEGDNPMAFNLISNNQVYKTYWFDAKHTTNMYKYNLMPGGARLNGSGSWCNGLGPANGCYPDARIGDIYHLFYTAYLAAIRPNSDGLHIGPVILHDYVDTEAPLSYHYFNVRWCRRLTDAELGYKLYINTDKTNIKKLYIDASAPEGYEELPHGYLRGFYVQYILNNPEPKVTIADIVNYSRSVEDNYVYNLRNNKSIIF